MYGMDGWNKGEDDCISRKAAIDAIHCDITVIGTANAETVARTIGEFVDRIKALPSAQPQRMRGRWIESDADGFVCSVCRNGYKMQPTLMGMPMFEFCPCCGARMDGGEQE